MTLVLPKHLEKRLEAIATERHVPVDTLVAQALEEFLAQQPQQAPRRNSKGFVISQFCWKRGKPRFFLDRPTRRIFME